VSRAPQPLSRPTLEELLARYLEWMETACYAAATVETRRRHLGAFLAWCSDRSLVRPTEVTRPALEAYRRFLFERRRRDGARLAPESQAEMLIAVRGFFGWLARESFALFNPAADMRLPRPGRRLPRHVLTVEQVERVLQRADPERPLGLRDRAILETLYATGMRRSELGHLAIDDVRFDRGTALVREGKGRKDRMLPIGERALAWIGRYLEEVRPRLAVAPDDGILFLTRTGQPFRPKQLTRLVGHYVGGAKVGGGSCHLFRHTVATLMLEAGADIRYIQQLLGHEELSTTQIYTRVTITSLKRIYERTHPAATLGPRRRVNAEAGELLSSLAAEALEENVADEDAGDVADVDG
jgi:integrase/recombinase XerD